MYILEQTTGHLQPTGRIFCFPSSYLETKINLYTTLILPVVLQWGETYALEIKRQEVNEELGGKRKRERKKKDRCHWMGGACSTHWNHKARNILIRHSDGKKIHRRVT